MDAWRFLPPSPDTVIAIANALIAAGTIVLAYGIPKSIRAASREERDSFYATIDRTYFDIQKLMIDYPHLAETDCSRKTVEQVTQYNAFALMVWNFIETVYDYGVQDKTLAATWEGVLRHEAGKHSAWFREPENRLKFKDAFLVYVENQRLATGTAALP